MTLKPRLLLIAGITLLIAGIVVAPALTQTAEPLPPSPAGLPDRIVFSNARIQPEGIEWLEDAGVFLHGSLSQGTIFQVSDDGSTEPFITNRDFGATVGLHIDRLTNRLLIPNGDAGAFFNQPPAGPAAALYAYDLTTRELIFFADASDLYPSSRHFANDVTSDAEGNAYLTDSFAPVIYRIDPQGNAEVWATDPRFGSDFLGLNGIDYHPDGFIIVAQSADGRWYKVPTDAPTAVTEITLSEPLATDGMVYDAQTDSIIAVARGRVVVVTSDDDWASGIVSARSLNSDLGGITTLTLRAGEVFAIAAQLQNPIALRYTIHRIAFDPPFPPE